MYKLQPNNTILRLSDQVLIPLVDGNPDYDEYSAWAAIEGNVVEPVLTLTDRRAVLWGAIKAERDRRKEAGVKVGAYWFHSDTISRIQQLGLVLLGASIPAGTQWKLMDGTFVTMTQTLAGQIFSSEAARDIAMHAHAEALKAQVYASETPESIDILAGWPATYEEETQ